MGTITHSESQPRKREQGTLAAPTDSSEQPFSRESISRAAGLGFKTSTNCYDLDSGLPAEVLNLLQRDGSSGEVKYLHREATTPSLFRVSSSSLLTPTQTTRQQQHKDFRASSSASSSSKFQPKNVQTKKFIFPSATTRQSQGSRQASTPRSSFCSSDFISDSKQQQEPSKPYPKGLVNFVKQMYKSKVNAKINPWTGTTSCSNGFFDSSTHAKQNNTNVFVTRIPLQLDFSSQKGSLMLQQGINLMEGENVNEHGGTKTPAKSARDTQIVKSNDTTNVDEEEQTTPLSGRLRISPSRKINLLNQITSRTGSAAAEDTATTPVTTSIQNQLLTAREISSNQDRPSTDRGTFKGSMFNSTTPNQYDDQRARYSAGVDSHSQRKLFLDDNLKILAENQLRNKRMLLQQQIDSVQFHRKAHVNAVENAKTGEMNLLRSQSALKSQQQHHHSHPHSTQQLKQTYALFVFINNLGNVKRKSNLQFTITDIPRIYNSIAKSKVEEDFQSLKLRVQHNIGLTFRSMYFFRQEGFPIQNHLDFAQIDTNQEAIFFGTQGSFSGLSEIYTDYPGQLFNVIQHLLQKVQYFNSKSDANDQKQPLQSSPSQPSSLAAGGILTKEQICSLHNRREAQKIAQALTFNPEAQLKNFSLVSKRERKLEQFEDLLQAELLQSQTSRSIVEMPDTYEREPDKNHTQYNLREIAKYIDAFLDKVEGKKQHSNLEKTSKYQGIERFWNSLRQPPGVDYIQDNISSCLNKTSVLDILQKTNRELFIQNIPKLLNKHELSRHDLHSIYILYKALLSVSVQKDDWRKVLEKGVHFAAFQSGIESLSSQGEETIKRMCNYNQFINWESFLAILSSIQGKSLESKINIFLRVSDKDKSGTLSKAEVEELCEICLSKFIPNKKGEDSIVIQLIEYFTRLLFSCLDVDINTEEIPLQKLRDAIINGHPESDLLCFFCGIN